MSKNQRLPLIVSFLLVIALCKSLAYWMRQFYTNPSPRPVPAVRVVTASLQLDAAKMLFGIPLGKAEVASNYQLKGVIMAGSKFDSIAILSANGKAAQTVRIGGEVMPGVTVKEVHRAYVLLSEGGAVKRVNLPEETKAQERIISDALEAHQFTEDSPTSSQSMLMHESNGAEPTQLATPFETLTHSPFLAIPVSNDKRD